MPTTEPMPGPSHPTSSVGVSRGRVPNSRMGTGLTIHLYIQYPILSGSMVFVSHLKRPVSAVWSIASLQRSSAGSDVPNRKSASHKDGDRWTGKSPERFSKVVICITDQRHTIYLESSRLPPFFHAGLSLDVYLSRPLSIRPVCEILLRTGKKRPDSTFSSLSITSHGVTWRNPAST